ncbi:MAG: hypothetical protein L6M37_07235 [Candidatus Methylarchaceae archaeon HK02M1]|nr:hypothetical protein [Candidatus Methylarchaceae archaeon HK02M1]
MGWRGWGWFGRGRVGWSGPWPRRGPFSYLPPWYRPGWFGRGRDRGACWWFAPYRWDQYGYPRFDRYPIYTPYASYGAYSRYLPTTRYRYPY